MQEMLQRSYITQHPTSGYKTATKDIKRVKPKEPEDEDNKTTGLQQLLSISLHYVPTFFDTLKQQKLNGFRDKGWEEAQVLQHEQVLRETKLLELYIVLRQQALDMWLKLGRVPASYMDNATDTRHGYDTFHMEVQYAINDFINLYLYNFPEEYNQTAVQFTGQDYYFTVVHSTTYYRQVLRTHDERLEDADEQRLQLVCTQRRRQTIPDQGRTHRTRRTMEDSYRGKHRNVVEDKRDYRQMRVHDYSVITTHIYLDEDYIKKLITEIYQQAEKEGVQPAHKHRLLLFLTQHYLHK
eukprot:4798791-Amphidinium_carterae.3